MCEEFKEMLAPEIAEFKILLAEQNAEIKKLKEMLAEAGIKA